MSLTQAQKEERLNYVTATDVPTILGLSPWGNIVDLWREKVRLSQTPDISDKPAVKAGIYLEPVIAQWFSDETGYQLEMDDRLMVHKDIPYLAAHTDRVIVGEPAILECKTASRSDGWGDIDDNTIPDYYLAQVAHEAMCWNKDRCHTAVLINGRDFRGHYIYERDPQLEGVIIEACEKFWECVKSNEPPTPRSSAEIISLYGYVESPDSIGATKEIKSSVEQLIEVKAKIKEWQKKQKELENTVKLYMGNCSTLVDTEGKPLATWKLGKPSKRFDLSRFRDEQPELCDEYYNEEQSTRRFMVK